MSVDKDWRIGWIRKNLLPLLDKTDGGEEGVSKEAMEAAEIALSEAYLDEGPGISKRLMKVGGPLLILDALFVMPAQLYGLVFSITGTWILLVEGDFQDRFGIAVRAADAPNREADLVVNSQQVNRLARQSVMANIGLVWLSIGFLLQVIALLSFPSGNAIPWDFYPDIISTIADVLR